MSDNKNDFYSKIKESVKDWTDNKDNKDNKDNNDNNDNSDTDELWGNPAEPITMQFPLPTKLDEVVPYSGVARWNTTPYSGNPYPDPKKAPQRTVLKQHVQFFDLNNDGYIQPWEVFQAGMMLGFPALMSFFAAIAVPILFSYRSQDSWIPSPTFAINVENIHRCVHGSGSGAYDTEGRFVPRKFEELFTKFDKGNKGYLTFGEVCALWYYNNKLWDIVGGITIFLELLFLWLLIGGGLSFSGGLSKKQMHLIYNGDLFHRVFARRNELKKSAVQYKMLPIKDF